MFINSNIYNQIVFAAANQPPAIGGILGGKDNVISRLAFDKGIALNEFPFYIPDTKRLNEITYNWKQQNVTFYGLVHSRFKKSELLSADDERYIKAILSILPEKINCLYFVFSYPDFEELLSFKAYRENGNINIANEHIDIITFRPTNYMFLS